MTRHVKLVVALNLVLLLTACWDSSPPTTPPTASSLPGQGTTIKLGDWACVTPTSMSVLKRMDEFLSQIVAAEGPVRIELRIGGKDGRKDLQKRWRKNRINARIDRIVEMLLSSRSDLTIVHTGYDLPALTHDTRYVWEGVGENVVCL